jgi:hypothetical protein
MGSTSLISLRGGARVASLAAAALCAGVLPGCLGGESEPDEAVEVAPDPPRGRVSIGEYLLHIQPKAKRVTIERVAAIQPSSASKAGAKLPGVSPQVFSDINLQSDDVPGSGPTNSVELVTDQNSIYWNDAAHCGSSQSFCADVTLNSFWSRHLSNVYVEITSIVDTDGNDLSGHGASNSDSPPTTCTPTSGCPSNALGLWRYTQTGADPGVLDSKGSAMRQWRFANPDDVDTYVKVRVVATLSYSSYTLSTSFRTVADACTTGGTQIPTSTATRTATMPFAATFYTYTSTTLKFNKHGFFVPGGVSITNSGTNVQLPNATAAAPGFFPFWDNLDYGTSGLGMCFATVGTAPARQFVVSWHDMTFKGTTTASHLTFSAAVHEGSDEIDFYYQTMSGPNARARGNSATVGAQDPSATVAAAGSTYNTPLYSSGKSFTLIPIP